MYEEPLIGFIDRQDLQDLQVLIMIVAMGFAVLFENL
jgi:hypothetical protein